MKFVNNNNFILFISILFLSCEVFYPYEDDCGVVDGSNKLIAGQCYDTHQGAMNDIDVSCCDSDYSCVSYLDDDSPSCDSQTMCCTCGGGYVADGTEDCPLNPEIHN